jgi:hypothetical protein
LFNVEVKGIDGGACKQGSREKKDVFSPKSKSKPKQVLHDACAVAAMLVAGNTLLNPIDKRTQAGDENKKPKKKENNFTFCLVSECSTSVSPSHRRSSDSAQHFSRV